MMNNTNEEMFDILNEDGSYTGTKATRSETHRKGLLHGASHICIYRTKNGTVQILMQKRSDTKDSFPGAYDLSSAGHMESGSTFRKTAHKELFEELGIDINESMLIELFDYRISSQNTFHGSIFKNEEICRVYAANLDIDPTSLRFQESEVAGAEWFDIDFVNQKIQSGDKEFCTDKYEFSKIADTLKLLINK